MTKLTTERLEYYAVLPTKPAERKAIFMYEVRCMARQLLAYEQAAKNPVAWVATDSEGFPEYNGHNEFSADCGAGTPLYAAPVLPKQPERLPIISERELFKVWNNDIDCPIAGIEPSNAAWKAWISRAAITPAQPELPKQPDATITNEGDITKIIKAAEKLVRCKGRYHSEQNYRALAALFSVTVPDLPPLPSDEAPAKPVSEPYKLPSGYALVPCKLTAENGAKSCMIGEFTEQTEISCPECFGDDECETCDGSGMIEVTVPVSWTTIKDIWAKGIEHFAAAPAQESE